jgi:uncharacterized protein (TIGR02300 family)
MATKQARGTKRTCQNEECGARFYDLNRNPIVCPVCEEMYEIASSPLTVDVNEEKARFKGKRADYDADKGARAEDAERAEPAEESLEDLEVADEEVAAEADETFLEEEEEEGGNLSNVIGGPVAEGEEET